MQLAGLQVDVVLAQRHQFAGAHAVPIGEQDRRGVPMAPPVGAGGIHQLLDLALRKIVLMDINVTEALPNAFRRGRYFWPPSPSGAHRCSVHWD